MKQRFALWDIFNKFSNITYSWFYSNGAFVTHRYHIKQKVGQGQSAAVFEAEDTWLNSRRVAIKVLIDPSPEYRALLAEEFALLFGLAHPHLPRVFELGRMHDAACDFGDPHLSSLPAMERGVRRPFLVEEFCAGTTAGSWPHAQRASENAAFLGAQLAAALACLHVRGVMHGDIKPGNILVQEQDAVPFAKLLDFNLSQTNTRKEGVSGTLRYMAKEALEGAPVCASDVYSLGATLAHMLAGKPPDNDYGTQVCAECLAQEIAAMTHPDAGRRPSAAEVFDMLSACANAKHQQFLFELKDAKTVPTSFVGRDNVLGTIRHFFASRIGNGTKCLRIVAPAGGGKTAVLEQAVIQAALRHFWTPGSVRPSGHGDLFEMERALSEIHGKPQHILEKAKDVQHTTKIQWKNFSVLADHLKEICDKEPLALIFDDVPLGSPLDAFGKFLERLEHKGPNLLWLQTQAWSDEQGQEPLAPNTVMLDLLDEESVTKMVQLARPLRPHDVRAAKPLCKASGGNPMAAQALLHDHPGDALLVAAQDGSLARAHMSDESFLRQLSTFDSTGQDLLLSMSLFDAPVPIDMIEKIDSISQGISNGTIERAIGLGVLKTVIWNEKPAITLSSDMVRFAYARQVPDALALEIAQTLEAMPEANERALDLGKLWERLGHLEKACSPLLQGARKKANGLQYHEALEAYDTLVSMESALKSALPKEQAKVFLNAAWLESARLLLALGKHDQAISQAEKARESKEGTLIKAEALIGLGQYASAADVLKNASLQTTGVVQGSVVQDAIQGSIDVLCSRALMLAGNYAEAENVAKQAMATHTRGKHQAELMGVLGLLAFYKGNSKEAETQLEQALDRAKSQSNQQLTERIRANLALVLHKTGDLSGAEQGYGESLAWARSQQDLPSQLLRLSNLATLKQEQGNVDTALEAYEEAYTLARLVDGQREMVRIALNWSNLLCSWLGDAHTARQKLEPAILQASKLGMLVEKAFLLLLRAEMHLVFGDNAKALHDVEDAHKFFASSNDASGLADAEATLAEVCLHRRDAQGVRKHALRAEEQAKAIGRKWTQCQALLWYALAELEEPSLFGNKGFEAAIQAAHNAKERHDVDMAWLAHAVASRLCARAGNAQDAEKHLQEARQLARTARSRLSAKHLPLYGDLWFRREMWAWVERSEEIAPEQPIRDFDRLLAINRELAQDHDPDRLLERIIDAAIALSGAERGFVVLKADTGETEDDLVIRAARNLDHTSLDDEQLLVSRSIAFRSMRTGQPINSTNALDDERFRENVSVHQMQLRSVLCLPLRAPKHSLGALYLDNRYRVNAFSDADVALLSAFGDQAAIALFNARLVSELDMRSKELEKSRTEIEILNQRLQKELEAQSKELEWERHKAPKKKQGRTSRHGMVGTSAKMQQVFHIIERVADKEAPVVVLGESGTGKELVARAVHAASAKSKAPFISINCAAIPKELLESELFGHEKGAFTGAVRTKPGLFEVARQGTVFLDEIGDMPLDMQAKLLRVLQQKEFRRVGGTLNLKTEARVLSASNQDLETLVRNGRFREDLWYRLNVVEIRLPPLRERREDLPLLINHFLKIHGGKTPPEVSREALALLLDYAWPGNVRELENEMQRATALAEGVVRQEELSTRLTKPCVPMDAHANPVTLKSAVEQFESQAIQQALARHHGKVATAAKELGLTRAGLYKKLHKYGHAV